MRAAAAAGLLLAALFAAPAAAQQRAFMLTGSESMHRSETRGIADAAPLPDGSVALLTADARVRLLDRSGRSRLIGRVPERNAQAGDLDVLPDGAFAVVSFGRVWRIGLDGSATPLTPAVRSGDPGEVFFAAPAPDGSLLLSLSRRVVRQAPDGSRTTLAGSGRLGEPRAGPALRSPFEFLGELAATPRGLVFSSGGVIWRLEDGTMRRHAGGGRVSEDAPIPAGGRRADQLHLDSLSTIAGDPDGELLAASARGVYVIRGGVLREIADADFEAREPRPPLWSGDLASRAWLSRPSGVGRTADGGWLVGTDDGVALLTAPDGRSEHLAVAVETTTLATAADGAVRVAATRDATVRLRANAGGRRIAEVTTPVTAGTNVLRLPAPLPPGVVTLTVRATAADGAVARHSLAVLGTRALSLDVARGALRLAAGTSSEFVAIRRCRADAPTRVSCSVGILDQESARTNTVRQAVTLRRDGWLWVSGRYRARRVELLAPRG